MVQIGKIPALDTVRADLSTDISCGKLPDPDSFYATCRDFAELDEDGGTSFDVRPPRGACRDGVVVYHRRSELARDVQLGSCA
ncbi:hypothetical protein L3Y34_008361 [Caenorhabditis briggsae]|uniref:Uncharacterized protein n=1 Tax=Caenorhabditis briggsae TaxID=6238 RepID=A0AAE9A4I9_CAEBR|nr:hypothetical protein L3Y34_008361 [Caenorhabditis briggsae]